MATTTRGILSSFLVVLILATGLDLGLCFPITADLTLRDCTGCTSVGSQCCQPVNGNSFLARGTQVTPQCIIKGETVNNDPFWLYVNVPSLGNSGWVPDYYVDCGGGDYCVAKSCLS